MGRMLSTTDYGLFSAMMALFAIFSAPLGTLMLVISRKVSAYRAAQEVGSIRHFYRSIFARTAVLGAVLVAISLLFAPYLQTYLRSPSVIPVYLLGVLLLVTFPTVINDAYLQAHQRFSWLSASTTLRLLLKIVFSVALVWMGCGVAGIDSGSVRPVGRPPLVTHLPRDR